jgi:hypothetical protein
VWDRLHRTLRLNVPQLEITIGVSGFQSVDAVGVTNMVALPFDPDVPLADRNALRERTDSGDPPTLLMP